MPKKSDRTFFMLPKDDEMRTLIEAVQERMAGKLAADDITYTAAMRFALRFTVMNIALVDRERPNWRDDYDTIDELLAPHYNAALVNGDNETN